MRKDLLVSGQVYHTFSKSIAEFRIFNNIDELMRMRDIIRYYQKEKPSIKFSKFIKLSKERQNNIKQESFVKKEEIVQILAYCIMPTHIHLVLKQLKDNGISIFISNILNSYSRYFNIKHKRKGPLWEGRFKSLLVADDEYLLHLTRYIHLNPVTAGLVDKTEDWEASSYNEYMSKINDRMCDYEKILNIEPAWYKDFVDDRASYQRELAKIKSLLIDT